MKAQRQTKSIFTSWWVQALLLAAVALVAFTVGYGMDQSQDQSQTSTTYEEAVVIRVIDGDTIELDDGRRVRYIGIDTPETVHPEKDVECYGPEATVRNRELVEGKTVEMQAGVEESDRYGRLLRYVHVDGRFVNALLVAEGYARASSFGDEKRFRQVFVQLEQYSQMLKRGMWEACE